MDHYRTILHGQGECSLTKQCSQAIIETINSTPLYSIPMAHDDQAKEPLGSASGVCGIPNAARKVLVTQGITEYKPPVTDANSKQSVWAASELAVLANTSPMTTDLNLAHLLPN